MELTCGVWVSFLKLDCVQSRCVSNFVKISDKLVFIKYRFRKIYCEDWVSQFPITCHYSVYLNMCCAIQGIIETQSSHLGLILLLDSSIRLIVHYPQTLILTLRVRASFISSVIINKQCLTCCSSLFKFSAISQLGIVLSS